MLKCNLEVAASQQGHGAHDGVILPHQAVDLGLLPVPGPGLHLRGHHALVRDCLHVILIRVSRAEESILCLTDGLETPAPEDCALDLRRVIEPHDLDPHVSCPRLPHRVDPPDVWKVRAAGAQKHSAVPHRDCLDILLSSDWSIRTGFWPLIGRWC